MPSRTRHLLSVLVGDHAGVDHVGQPAFERAHGLQFEALITAARLSANPNDFALIALLGLLGLRIFQACGASIADLGEEHGHRVLRVRGKGGKVVLVPLPPAVARAIDRAVDGRDAGPVLRNTLGARMDRHGSSIWRRRPVYACRGCTRTCCATPS